VRGCICSPSLFSLTPPTPPTPACNTQTGIGCPCNPPSRGCLFKLSEEPNEHNDLAGDPAYSAVFERLLARLAAVSQTGVVAAGEMLGKKVVRADGVAACAVVSRTQFYEPYATRHPYLVPWLRPNMLARLVVDKTRRVAGVIKTSDARYKCICPFVPYPRDIALIEPTLIQGSLPPECTAHLRCK
jgi:hypothetical protein